MTTNVVRVGEGVIGFFYGNSSSGKDGHSVTAGFGDGLSAINPGEISFAVALCMRMIHVSESDIFEEPAPVLSTKNSRALIRSSQLAANEAVLLLAAVSGLTHEQMITDDDGFDASVVESYRALCKRREAGEPIAYLIGKREFYGRVFRVNKKVLIPRSETELLVDLALQRIGGRGEDMSLLDLGTGSGIIAVSIMCERSALDVTATDVSPAALTVATDNARQLGARIRVIESDWFTALNDMRYDVIVSNPPYIAAHDAHLLQGDLRHEPRGALTDGNDGLSALRTIIAGSPGHLNPGGWLLLEHGYDQADAVRLLLAEAGFTKLQCWRDLAGIERVSGGQLTLLPG